MNIGKYNILTISRKSPHGYYLADEDATEVLLPSKYVNESMSIGDEIEVFVYTDSQDRPVAVLDKPYATVGEAAFLKVKDVNDNGAFVDWGLEKDLFVPHALQKTPMELGKSYVVVIFFDKVSSRVAASSKLYPFLNKDVACLEKGMKISGYTYNSTPYGLQVVLEGLYQGMLDISEKNGIEYGDKKDFYITHIREDGKINLSLIKKGYTEIDEAAEMILDKLKESSQGFIDLGDKSSPEEIKKVFPFSKRLFKSACGNLYKKRVIEVAEFKISIKK